jgi:hypothetical protein
VRRERAYRPLLFDKEVGTVKMKIQAMFAIAVIGIVSAARAAEPIQPAAANLEQSVFSTAEPVDFASQWGIQPVS